MIDIKLRYQASIFVNAEDIEPSPEVTTDLINIFSDRKLIPNTFQELSRSSPNMLTRLRLSDTKNEWNIVFLTNRIDINKNPTDSKGSNIGELSDFCLDANSFFERILTKFNKPANRLVLDTSVMLEEMTEDQLASIYTKLFKPPKFYEENPPFEWDWRSASHFPMDILNLSEDLFVIIPIKRVTGGYNDPSGVIKFDRIQLAPDINTTARNTNYRFNITHVTDFLHKARDIHNRLLTEIEEYING